MAVFTGVVRTDEVVVLKIAIVFTLAVNYTFILYLLYFFAHFNC